MNDSSQERFEAEVLKSLHMHLSACLDTLNHHAASGKIWQPDLRQIDARLLICRKHIESLGAGYSTTED
jgi:hypothetical protein